MHVELRDETLAEINDYPGVEIDCPSDAPGYAQAVLRDICADIADNIAPYTYHRNTATDYNCTCGLATSGRHYYDGRPCHIDGRHVRIIGDAR